MKRTGEKVLVWIGIILQFILIFLMAIVTPFLNDISVKNELVDGIYNSDMYNQGTSQMDASSLVDIASQIFLLALVIVIICTVLAIVFALFINKIPKVVGVCFILLGIITVLTLNWLTAVLWLIAGIMLLARKQKHTDSLYKSGEYNNYNSNQRNYNGTQRTKVDNTRQTRNKLNDSEQKESTQFNRSERNKK
ncbi:DUF4064 domain-containing protein [Staphylococcus pseudoxylosus]|uniref:DUF4064 domain-containing protein n=2 Tax=Staphylococcus pseudoxylosus TaxID=2282419 RepID=UPI000F53233F|nr:DUF4064 domain-containing protein [Staphylococcus pseudoxylosus]RQM83838.1 hypothetical protein CO206_10160 [Staphylococcus xylosus]MBM2657520.1 DUF4064 domain-containing protein [Staphylococcus pseudoxylosus]MDW8545182.1 DUF4064 domain-containing protein [Staphylococcus pseudoxylosus]MEB5782362.1 DUF4064 domain-containing protein [Staphylococcus pseudoxylosus]MEB6331485.1 DUF4064 domain-containing protein [Staphylococcus pseudoxylosus]